jgi:hypothetical protein
VVADSIQSFPSYATASLISYLPRLVYNLPMVINARG